VLNGNLFAAKWRAKAGGFVFALCHYAKLPRREKNSDLGRLSKKIPRRWQATGLRRK